MRFGESGDALVPRALRLPMLRLVCPSRIHAANFPQRVRLEAFWKMTTRARARRSYSRTACNSCKKFYSRCISST